VTIKQLAEIVDLQPGVIRRDVKGLRAMLADDGQL
jgi:hypothetical protein